MMNFFEDTNLVRSTLARISSYLVSLSDAGKFSLWPLLSFPQSGL